MEEFAKTLNVVRLAALQLKLLGLKQFVARRTAKTLAMIELAGRKYPRVTET